MITKEQATVYRGGGRRWLTRRAAIRAEAVAIIKCKHPTERSETDKQGRCIDPGWHWTDLPRADVLLRRVARMVSATLAESTKGGQR